LGPKQEFINRSKVEQEQILRGLVLRISWDKDDFTSVETPLGDFFGTGPGLNRYRSLMSGVSGNTLYSRWFMPFESGVRIEIENQSPYQVEFEMAAITGKLSNEIGEYGRFHAKWHDGPFCPALKSPREVDFPLLITTGTRGRFCGVMLNVFNTHGGWWGEGDEKFFVDGENFPSYYGTGSEDYFGYVWCGSKLFENPYFAQTRNDFVNTGHISVVRYHLADNVPFQEGFSGYIENYSLKRNEDMRLPYRAIPFWYQEKAKQDNYLLPAYEERTGYYDYDDMAWTNFKDEGGIEMESVINDIKSSGKDLSVKGIIPQKFEDGTIVEVSGYTVARWQGEEGDSIILPISRLSEPGKYHLKLKILNAKGSHRGRSHGTFLFEGGREPQTIEIEDMGDGFVLSPQTLAPKVLDLGVFDITENSSLTITMMGNGYQYMDLDFLYIEPLIYESRLD